MTFEHLTFALVAGLVLAIGYALGAYERRTEATWRLEQTVMDALDDYELAHAMPPAEEAVATTRARAVVRAITGTDPPDLSRLDLADGLTHTAPTKGTP